MSMFASVFQCRQCQHEQYTEEFDSEAFDNPPRCPRCNIQSDCIGYIRKDEIKQEGV